MDEKIKQFNDLRQKLQFAKNEKQRYTYSYKPLPVSPFPNDIAKDIGVVPLGTFTPDANGVNKLSEGMMKLNTLQTPKTCLINAAVLATKYTTPTNLDTGAFGGTFTDSTKTLAGYKTQEMERVDNSYTVEETTVTKLQRSFTWESDPVTLTDVVSILTANYGYPKDGGNINGSFVTVKDVTDTIRKMVTPQGKLEIRRPYNDLFNDPLPGIRKALKISYYVKSKEAAAPPPPPPPPELKYSYTWENAPVNLQKITSISSANYGYPRDGNNISGSFVGVLDVTQKIQTMVSNGNLTISQGYNSLFSDPRGGVRKVLKIGYYQQSSDGPPPNIELIDGLHFRVFEEYINDEVRSFDRYPQLVAFDTRGVDTLDPKFDINKFKLPTNFINLDNNTSVDFGNMDELTLSRGTPYERKVKLKQTDGKNIYSIPKITGEFHKFTVEWTGYFVPDQTGLWTFYINSDDFSFLWIDSDGKTYGDTYTKDNATVKNSGLHGMQTRDNDPRTQQVPLTKWNKYFIRFTFGENWGGYNMIVTAKRPDGSRFSDFKGFFYADVIVSPSQSQKNSTFVSDIRYNLKGTPVQVAGKSLSDLYNQSYSTADPNPIYVSLIKSTEYGDNLYDCYINRQTPDANKTISDVFARGGEISKFNVVNLWQSTVMGDTYNGACMISENASVYIDSVNNQLTMESTPDVNMPKFNTKDRVHVMFIYEEQKDIGNGKTAYFPKVILRDVVANRTYAINIGSTEFNRKMNAYAPYQVATQEWVHERGRCLAYNIDNVSATDTEKNEELKAYGSIVRITKDDPVVSVNRVFRLVMVNGRLTLQMSINATLPITNIPGIKLNTVYSEIAPNTFPMAKVNINSNMDQLNLYDNTYKAGFVVPKEYVTYDGDYTSYDEVYPFIPSNPTNEVSRESTAQCKAKCDADTNCRAFYSFTESGTPGCKIQKIGDPTDPAVFNPKQPNTNISNSKLYVKNKKIGSDFNKTETDIPYNVHSTGDMKNAKQAYYPDNPTKNKDVYFDTVKAAIVQRKKDLSVFSENPANYIPTERITQNVDMTGYVDASMKESAGYADLKNLTDYDKKPEGFTDLRMNEADVPMRTSVSSAYGMTQIKDFEAQCRTGKNIESSFGICQALSQLRAANVNLDTISQNDLKMVQKARKIKDDVSEIDRKFVNMSNLYKDEGKTKPNPYAPDFNGYDDTPDYTTEGALRNDINETLLNENTLYILGTITTATVLILAIAMARS